MSTQATKPADERAPEGGASPAPAKGKKKKVLLLGGGAVGPIALAWALSLAAIPKKHKQTEHALAPPYLAEVSPSNGFQINLDDRDSKHYLAMTIKAEVQSYVPTYVATRSTDPLYHARISDSVLKESSAKTKPELDDPTEKEQFREELRAAIEPVIFPLHLGNETSHIKADEESGLRWGSSIETCTYRGLFYEHRLSVDAGAKTIRLDDGAIVSFGGEERDLRVYDKDGQYLPIDVSDLHEDFLGEVHVGTLGFVKAIYFMNFLTQ